MVDKYKICFLGYKLLSDIARRAISKADLPNTTVDIVDVEPNTMNDIVTERINQGYEVFVAGSSNAAAFRRKFRYPLIEIKLQAIDFTSAAKKAMSLGKHPAVVSYKHSVIPDLRIVEEILGIKLEQIIYEDTYELYEKLAYSSADVIIGSALPVEAAEKLGRKSVLIYHGESTIEDCLRRARYLLKELRRERNNSEINRALVRNISTGVIGLNGDGTIMLYNRAAEQITGITRLQVGSHQASEIFPSLHLVEMMQSDQNISIEDHVVGEEKVKLTRIKIESNNSVAGVLALLEPLQEQYVHTPSKSHVSFQAKATFRDLVGSSEVMRQVISRAKSCCKMDSPMIITGDTGTGKRMLAQCIHNFVRHEDENYVTVNCATVPDETALFYFFGREGSGERERQSGVVELAHGGTLVLENVWQASEKVQACLLQVVQDKSYTRVGSSEVTSCNLRIITILSTEKLLEIKTALRPDLYYSLNSILLEVPSLAQRKEDVQELFTLFVKDDPTMLRREFSLPERLYPILLGYSWPGNVRELRNVCKRFVLFLGRQSRPAVSMQRRALIDAIGENELFENIIARSQIPMEQLVEHPQEFAAVFEEMKRTISMSNEEIAKRLKISRTTMWRLVKESEN